jgi:capsule biosynthesis phosphatase
MPEFVFDLDGTIFTGDYESPVPNWSVIWDMQALFRRGARIVIFTARGMNTARERFPDHSRAHWAEEAERMWCDRVCSLLAEHSVPYHELLFGKPSGDVYVDDKAIRPDELDDYLYNR